MPANYLKLYLKQGSCVVPQDGLVRSERRVEIAILLLAASLLLCGQAFGQGRKSVAARVSAIVASGRLGELHWPNF